MKARKLFVIFAVLAIMLAGFASRAAFGAESSKIDQRVLDQIEANGTAQFHVVMTVQADVSGAAELGTKAEKTAYVFDTLRSTAAKTQAPLLTYLNTEKATYESFYIYNMIAVTGDRTMLQWLAARSEVARIVPVPDPRTEPVVKETLIGPQPPLIKEFGPANGSETIEWNILRVNANDVWDMGFRGEGMVVASNDTGVDYTHPALVNHYRGNLGGGNFNHNYNWWGGSGSPAPVDGDGHGTHTTGTMVGDDGGSNQIGVAPGAKWIACAGLGGSDTVECFEFFLAPWDLNHLNPDPTKAPDSINNSWYDPSGYDYRPIIQNLNAAGIAVIKSAGNNGPSCSSISNPGYVPEIISTAAFAQGDTIASFSSRGPMSNYGEVILKPEVAAPGVNIRSSVPGGAYDGTYSGTSMAAPHSTALVALIWNAAPCLRGNVPATKQIMMDTAQPKIDAQCAPFVDHPNDVWGWGILDAQAAVQAAMGVCGGSGWLDGTVTDASSGLALENAQVTATADSGFSRADQTDASGYYTMTLLNGDYTVVASLYGYTTQEISPVTVITDELTTQDFALAALPTYTVSGYVKDSVSGEPLEATVEFTDAPIAPVTTDPATGFYSISVAEGTWNLQATAAAHLAETQELLVDQDLTYDFMLDPLPCILLVDDDANNPDVRSYYTSALDNLGYDYAIWNIATDGDPASSSLLGYRHIVWFTGYPYSNTFNDSNEAAVGTYLEAGGNFFLSGQDYLYDMGLTNFARNYLHIASYTSDVNQATVTGQNVFSGLGPYGLSYFFNNYSDIVNPDAQGKVSFIGNQGNAAVSYDGTSFNTVFFGYPFEAIASLANRSAVMQRAVEFFGGCEPPVRVTIAPASQEHTGQPGTQVSFDYTVTNDSQVAQDVNLSVASVWPVEAPASTGVLQPGASVEVSVVVSIPSQPDVIIGQDTFTLTAEGVEGGVAEATGTTYANVTPGVEVSGPAGQSGQPLEVLSYEFEVTNTGDYTDTFSLGWEGAWQVSLPGGTSTGPLSPGASTTVTVLVTVPGDVVDGATDVTILTATSGLDPLVTGSAQVTSIADVMYYIYLPLIIKW